jgi:head-tail adaptor
MAKGNGTSRRDQLIAFQRETRTPDGGGGWTSKWDECGKAWAQADWIGGSETKDRGALRERTRYRFTVLSAEAESLELTVKDRLIWNDEIFNIRERPRRLRRVTETEIVAESGVAT